MSITKDDATRKNQNRPTSDSGILSSLIPEIVKYPLNIVKYILSLIEYRFNKTIHNSGKRMIEIKKLLLLLLCLPIKVPYTMVHAIFEKLLFLLKASIKLPSLLGMLLIIIMTIFQVLKRIIYPVEPHPKIKKEPMGLRNRRETCYMNSMMQALASSPKLIEQMKSFSSNTKLTLFLDILRAINRTSNKPFDIDMITEKLIAFMRTVRWDRPSQQDAIQLLSFFINAIHREINDKQKTMPPKFRLLHTFSESNQHNKVQDHLALAVPLCEDFTKRPGVELTSLLDAFFRPSSIDDGENTTSMFMFEETPEVLILHIQANEWSPHLGAYIKPEYYIQYNDILEYKFSIQRCVDESKCDDENVRYRLVAVVHHMGEVSGGHYITYRMYDGRWYLTNDEQVEEVIFRYDIVPYIMVYEKIVQ